MNARLDTLPAEPRPTRPPLPPLRPVLAIDVDAVLAVEVRAYPYPWSRGNFIDSLAAGYAALLAQGDDGGVVGYCIAMVGVDELHLLNLTVAPEHQGLGHGRALLRAVVAQAQALPVSRLLLEVRESNHRARRLYASHGFAELGRRRAYYPAREGREDAIVMSLALPEARDGLD
jgi:[ribosomal protein S18]-alanine N-acetyltransferase